MYTLITKVTYHELNKILIYFTLINPLILKKFIEACLCFACWFGLKGGEWRVGSVSQYEMESWSAGKERKQGQ